MRNFRILVALGLVATAGIAQADVSGTATIVSDYDFRGVTQTNEDPALQLSIDYAHESGWYLGTWGSNIDWLPEASTEVDFYTGFRGTAGDLGWDAGVNYYTYAGNSEVNTIEVYGKLTYSILTGSLYYTDDYYNTDEAQVYVAADIAIPAGPINFNIHAGFTDCDAFAEGDYKDYAAGISYSASNITLGLKYVLTDGADRFGASPGSDDRIVLSVSTALPWK